MNYKETLERNGVVEIECHSFTDEFLLDVSSVFGTIIPGARGELVQVLPARDKGEGPKGSFSYTVGYGAFPWHTDTAYWEVPARYLLLASGVESSCATLFQDFEFLRRVVPDYDYLMTRAVFLLDVQGKRRFLSPQFEIAGEKGYRLDFHIYQPVNIEARILKELIGEELETNYHRHIWTGHNVVVLDNWRMIHAREDAHEDMSRILKRIYINELD